MMCSHCREPLPAKRPLVKYSIGWFLVPESYRHSDEYVFCGNDCLVSWLGYMEAITPAVARA